MYKVREEVAELGALTVFETLQYWITGKLPAPAPTKAVTISDVNIAQAEKAATKAAKAQEQKGWNIWDLILGKAQPTVTVEHKVGGIFEDIVTTVQQGLNVWQQYLTTKTASSLEKKKMELEVDVYKSQLEAQMALLFPPAPAPAPAPAKIDIMPILMTLGLVGLGIVLVKRK